MDQQLKTLLRYVFPRNRDSVFVAIDGHNQDGKTDFMFLLMELAYEDNRIKHFGLNQEISNAPFEHDVICDLDTVVKRSNEVKTKYFYFLDELGKTAPRGMPYLKTNLELINELEVKRHDNLSFGSCSIGDVDRRIMSPHYVDVYIHKTSLSSAVVYPIRLKHKLEPLRLTDIPPTSIQFNSTRTLPFTLKPQNNAHIETPLLSRFRRWCEGEKALDVWGSWMQKQRDTKKLYELYANNLTHTD